MKAQDNDLALLPKTILLHGSYLLLSVVTDGEDGNGLKLEKISQFFQVLKLCLEDKKTQKSYYGFAPPTKFHVILFFVILPEHFVYKLRY